MRDNIILALSYTVLFVMLVIGLRYGADSAPRYYEDDMHTVDYDGHQFVVFDHSIIHHPECGCNP